MDWKHIALAVVALLGVLGTAVFGTLYFAEGDDLEKDTVVSVKWTCTLISSNGDAHDIEDEELCRADEVTGATVISRLMVVTVRAPSGVTYRAEVPYSPPGNPPELGSVWPPD